MMSEAERVFNETNRDRKRVARGAKNRVRGGGKIVRLPHDGLSKKEREAMSGEVKSYNMGGPMPWAEFRAMPLDLQQKYLDDLDKKFPGVPQKLVAEMFGVDKNTFAPYLYRNNLTIHRAPGFKSMYCQTFLDGAYGEAFMKWACGESPAEKEDAVTVNEPVTEIVTEPVGEPVVPNKTDVKIGLDVNNIALLLKSLAGTGAKLTIEINL